MFYQANRLPPEKFISGNRYDLNAGGQANLQIEINQKFTTYG